MEGKIGTKGPFVSYDEVNTFAKTSRQRNWKPFAIKWPFLASLALLCLLCITFLEVLLHRSMPLDKTVFNKIPKPDVNSTPASVARRAPTGMTSTEIATPSATVPSAYISLVSSISHSTTTSSTASVNSGMMATPVVVCTKTSTVTVTVAVTVSGTLTQSSTQSAPSVPCATTTTKYMTITKSAQIILSSSLSRPTTTMSSAGYINFSSSLSHPATTKPTTTSIKPSTTSILIGSTTCTTITTVAVTVTVTIRGTGAGAVTQSTFRSVPSIPCATTTTLYMTVSESAYVILSSSLSHPTTTPITTTSVKPTTVSTCSLSTLTITITAGTDDTNPTYIQPPTLGPSMPCVTTITVVQTGTGHYISLVSTLSTPVRASPTPSLTPYTTTANSASYIRTQSIITGVTIATTSSYPGITSTLSISTTGVHITLTSFTTPASSYPGTTPVSTVLATSNYIILSSFTTPVSSTYTQVKTQTFSYLNPSTFPSIIHATTPITSPQSTATSNYPGSSSGIRGMSPSTSSGDVDIASNFPNATSNYLQASLTSDGQLITSTIDSTPTTSQDPSQSTDTTVLQQLREVQRPDLLMQGDFTVTRYFAALFLPSILAILIKGSWQIIAVGLKMMEPFYQLSKPDGANARESLLDDHLGGTNSLNTFGNALRGRTLFITIIVVNLVVDLLAPISAESMAVIPLSRYYDDKGTLILYNPGWVLNRLFVRLLQAMLSLIVFVLVMIAILDHRRESELCANPSKIATMASLLNDPSVAHEIHHMDPNASNDEIEASIAHNHYKLGHRNEYRGLLKVFEATPHGMHRVNNPASAQYSAKRFIWYRLVDGLLVFLLVGILATVIAYWLDGSDSGFNQFFNSEGFGPRFILSLGASITTTTFQSFEREVRLMTPYRLLAEGEASARHTVLRSVDGTEVTGLFQSFKHGTLFPAFIAMVTLLGDVLIIMIACVPFNEGITFKAFTIGASFSVAIATIMLGTAIAVFFWRRKNKTLSLPLEPNGSLLAMWMSLSNSKNHLRDVLNEPGSMSDTWLKEKVMGNGALYWAGWTPGDHGRDMWCVDRESADREFPCVQAVFSDNSVPQSRSAELENPYHQRAPRDSPMPRRPDTSQSLRFVQTEYRENPIRRGERTEYQQAPVDQRSDSEQSFPHVQAAYRDRPAVQRGGYQQVQSRPQPDYEECDISDRSNFEHAYPHAQTDYRRGSAESRGGTEEINLL